MTDILNQVREALDGRYDVQRELGTGGSATVFLAGDLKHGRPVALKVLRPDLAAAVGSERFLREIRITASLNHPHILPLLDSGEADGLLYYVSPYQAEGSLRRRLSGEPVSLDDVVRIASQVAAALEHAHGHGVLHRDVKPENILFSEGLAVVADFGLGKAIAEALPGGVTRSGVPLGTPGYMSPEQAMGKSDLDARTDVYGLACVVYEMLVGETPGMWPTDEALRLGRLVDASPEHRERLDALPGRMEQVLTRALALRPDDRFTTPGAFVAALVTASERTAKLDDAAVQAVIRRAAELDAHAPPERGVLSIGTVEQVAAEVGIPPERVREAARELELDRPTDVAPRTRRPPAPRDRKATDRLAPPAPPNTDAYDVRTRRVVVERETGRRVPVGGEDRLVDEIEDSLGLVGHASGVGGKLTWSPAAQGPSGRNLVVTVTSGQRGARIHIEEQLELTGYKKAIPGWAGAGGAFLGLAMSAGLGGFMILFAAIMGALGIFVANNWVYWNDAVTAIPQLEGLADRLVEIIDRWPALGGGGEEGADTGATGRDGSEPAPDHAGASGGEPEPGLPSPMPATSGTPPAPAPTAGPDVLRPVDGGSAAPSRGTSTVALGARPGWAEIFRVYQHKGSRVVRERSVPGELSEEAMGAVVRTIQATLGEAGHGSALGGTLTWSPTAQEGTGRRLVLTVTPDDGFTDIRVEERYDLEGWRFFAPGWGAAGGALLTALIFIGLLGIDTPAVLVILALMAIVGALGTANYMLLGNARKRLPVLDRVADAVAETVRASLEGERPEIPDQDAIAPGPTGAESPSGAAEAATPPPD